MEPIDRDDVEVTFECIDCGVLVTPETERAYAVTEEAYLCFDCAVRRHGVYDELEDRWTTAPDISDEAPERLEVRAP